MRERLRELGGTLKIESSKAGTLLKISIPLTATGEKLHFDGTIPPRGASVGWCAAQPIDAIQHPTYLCRNERSRKPRATSSRLAANRRLPRPTSFGRTAVGKRWNANSKAGRYVETSREELNRWLSRESAGEPVQIATPATNMSAELKRELSFVRKQGRNPKKKAAWTHNFGSSRVGIEMGSENIITANLETISI
jgi:hypothetical protein